MTDHEYHEVFAAIRAEDPSPDFLADLWTDMDAEVDRGFRQDQLHPGVVVAEVPVPTGVEPTQLSTRRRWTVLAGLVAAAALVIAGIVISVDDPDTADDVIAAETRPPAPTAFLGPELRHIVNEAAGEQAVLDPLERGVVYGFARLPGTVVEVPQEPALPNGWAYTPRVDDGRNVDIDFIREVFVPGPAELSQYAVLLDQFRTPTGEIPAELFAYPLVELVRFAPLGATVAEVTATFVTNNALDVLSEPQPSALGGINSITFEARTTSRALIASTESTHGGNPVDYLYPAGSRLQIHIVDTTAGPLVAVISTDDAAFDQWQPIARRLLEGVSFGRA
jgi:hypothetical protein